MDAKDPLITDFNPRSPCGERLLYLHVLRPGRCISIHALLAESDLTVSSAAGSETGISIHALLAESDIVRGKTICFADRFQSTLSLRRATYFGPVSGGTETISIHALLAESDSILKVHAIHWLVISIHALLAESDFLALLTGAGAGNFNPRSPCGERLLSLLTSVAGLPISIHALLAESDLR